MQHNLMRGPRPRAAVAHFAFQHHGPILQDHLPTGCVWGSVTTVQAAEWSAVISARTISCACELDRYLLRNPRLTRATAPTSLAETACTGSRRFGNSSIAGPPAARSRNQRPLVPRHEPTN